MNIFKDHHLSFLSLHKSYPIFFYATIFLLMNHVFLYADRDSLNYKLKYNEALNAYDKNERDNAALTCKLLLREYKKAADVYLLLGRMHFEKGFNRIARSYFNKALQYEENFIIEESKLELYFSMAANYYQLKDEEMQINFLEKVIFTINNKIEEKKEGLDPINKKKISIPFIYKKYLGQAGFALGFVYYNREDFIRSKDYLQVAIDNKLQAKLSYLMIAHYYATRSQEAINRDLQEYYKKTKKLRSENRKIFFNFYYLNYHKTSITAYERKFFENNRYRVMLSDIEYYKLQLDVEEEKKINPRFDTEKMKESQSKTTKSLLVEPSLILNLNTNL